MDRLEDDNVVMDILTRLSVKSLMRCKCVCKRWRNLAQDRQFIRCHLMNRSAQENPGLILQSRYGKIYFLEHNEEEETHDYTCTEVRLPPLFPPDYEALLISSCNGLCLIGRKEVEDETKIYYIFNPITGSPLRLPDLMKPKFFRWNTRIEVGFNSVGNEYKVVVVYTCPDMQSEVFVHTVGVDGHWREMGFVPCVIKSEWKYSCVQVFVHGALHWFCSSHHNILIVSFSISNEVFEPIPHPEIITASGGGVDSFSLAVLKGCLSITDSSFFDHVELWMMNDYGVKESWTKLFSINLVQVGRIIGNFEKNHLLLLHPRISNVKTLCFQKNGELLILDHDDVLQSYNPKTMALRKLSIDTGFPSWAQVLTHVGSLVSFPGCCT